MKLLTMAILAGASVSLGIGFYLLSGWTFEFHLVSEDELQAACGMGVCGAGKEQQ